MTLTERFLKAKHWQIFILTFGLPMIFHIIIMVTFALQIASGKEKDILFVLDYIAIIPLFALIWMSIFFGWFWSIGVGLQSKIPENVQLNVSRFRIFFFIPIIYFVLLIVVIGGSIAGEGVLFNNTVNPDEFIIGIIAVIVPLHLFSMFCMFHTLYFVAKTLKTAELQRETSFSDFAGEFFLIWFYPIGIWIIQPKVNQLYEGKEKDEYEKYY